MSILSRATRSIRRAVSNAGKAVGTTVKNAGKEVGKVSQDPLGYFGEHKLAALALAPLTGGLSLGLAGVDYGLSKAGEYLGLGMPPENQLRDAPNIIGQEGPQIADSSLMRAQEEARRRRAAGASILGGAATVRKTLLGG